MKRIPHEKDTTLSELTNMLNVTEDALAYLDEVYSAFLAFHRHWLALGTTTPDLHYDPQYYAESEDWGGTIPDEEAVIRWWERMLEEASEAESRVQYVLPKAISAISRFSEFLQDPA